MLRRMPAGSLVPALEDAGHWLSPHGSISLAEMSEAHLAAVLATLEDRAEELYRAATGRAAASCMAATVWLYARPFCAAAVAEIGHRGADYLSLKREAKAALSGAGSPASGAASGASGASGGASGAAAVAAVAAAEDWLA